MIDNIDVAERAVQTLLDELNLDEGEHTRETPKRVVKAWRERVKGYDIDPREILQKTFPAEYDPGIVIVKGVSFSSTCAHHLLPITGKATIAYRPDPSEGQVVGLSKLSRVFQAYALRLQIQEQLGHQVVETLQEVLHPVGSACIITAEHGCMTVRGVQDPGTLTTTVSTSGSWSLDRSDVDWVLDEHRH